MKQYLLIALLAPFSLFSFDLCSLFQGHRLGVGPEFFYTSRRITEGSKQDGWLYGVHGHYIRQVPWGIMWGVEGYYAYGNIEGNDTTGTKRASWKSDAEVEGYLGFTFYQPICTYGVSFTPFAGYGNFWGENIIKEPVHCKTNTRFHYYLAAAELKLAIHNDLDVAVCFKTKFVEEAERFLIRGGEVRRKRIGDKVNYEVDFPLTFSRCVNNKQYSIELVPFYRFRDYGAWENSPHDFKEEQYRIWGGRVMFNYHF
ncbi:MAG: hypothetical protein WDZ27_02560 [Waddliaceae bacterium]